MTLTSNVNIFCLENVELEFINVVFEVYLPAFNKPNNDLVQNCFTLFITYSFKLVGCECEMRREKNLLNVTAIIIENFGGVY